MLAACRTKGLSASANGTVPAKTVCVPISAPNTAVTVDDFEAWQECDALLESLRPVSCAEIEDSFQHATGCGPACYQDFVRFQRRLGTCCVGLPEETCAFKTAPCKIKKTPPPSSTNPSNRGGGGSINNGAAPTPATLGNNAIGVGTPATGSNAGGGVRVGGGGGSGSNNLAPIIGGVAGGLLLLLLAIIALLLVRKKQRDSTSNQGSGKGPLIAEEAAVPFNGAAPSMWQHAPQTPPGQWQGGAPQWGPPGAGNLYYNDTPRGGPGSQPALSMHSASGAAWPTGSSIRNSNSGSHAAAPAQRQGDVHGG